MLTTLKQMTNTHTQRRGYHHNLTIRFPLVTQNANHKPLLSDKASVHNLTMMQRDMISKQGATIERHSILLMYNEIRTGLRHVLDRRSSDMRSGWSYSGAAQKSRSDWASFVFTIRLWESESGVARCERTTGTCRSRRDCALRICIYRKFAAKWSNAVVLYDVSLICLFVRWSFLNCSDRPTDRLRLLLFLSLLSSNTHTRIASHRASRPLPASTSRTRVSSSYDHLLQNFFTHHNLAI